MPNSFTRSDVTFVLEFERSEMVGSVIIRLISI
uniref:Uncharacterized protein n=1 Tax=Anguilla anguilla TaxID=7936 RepID=A0A0E9RDU3_ANGAN